MPKHLLMDAKLTMSVSLFLSLSLSKQHEEEPPQGVGKEGGGDQTEKLSKMALKNKRKREAKQRTKEQDVR